MEKNNELAMNYAIADMYESGMFELDRAEFDVFYAIIVKAYKGSGRTAPSRREVLKSTITTNF